MIQEYHTLQGILADMKNVAVAFSGGIDSAFLVMAAQKVLGKNVLALTAASETLPQKDLEGAKELARSLGVNHLIVPTYELELADFVKNHRDRCYICKKYRFEQLMLIAMQNGFSHIIDGENADDAEDSRPGRRAVRELGIKSPLKDAGFYKADIRALAKNWGLSIWNKPASACLASRIPYHSPITAQKLWQIDQAETFIWSLNICSQVRVRLESEGKARIELNPEAIEKFVSAPIRKSVTAYFKNLGIYTISLDMEGYRTGSLI